MKIILEFNDDEVKQAEQAYRGADYAMAVEDFRNLLRDKIKYSDLTEEESKVYAHIWDSFHITFHGLLND